MPPYTPDELVSREDHSLRLPEEDDLPAPPAPPAPPEAAPGPGAWTDRPLTHGPHWMVSRRTGRVLVDVQIRADHAPYDRITRGPLNDTDARWWAFPAAPRDLKGGV